MSTENLPSPRDGIWMSLDPPLPYSGLSIDSRDKWYEALQGADGRVRYFVNNREVEQLPSTPLTKLLLRQFATMEHLAWMPSISPEQIEQIQKQKKAAASKNKAGQIINPYPDESAGQAVFGSRRKYDDEIRQAMARAFFVSWYASEQERRTEDGLKATLAGPGQDWMDVAPNTSNAAKRHAREYAAKLQAANQGATLTDLYAAALNAGGRGPARDFGHYVAMQAMGHGVSWFDDNPEFPIEIPHGEFYG